MKRILGSSILAALFIVAACTKDENKETPVTNPPLVTQPEATVANDGKSGGVYKGVILGSSGTVKIVMQDREIVAIVTIDGVTKNLKPTNMPTDWVSGDKLFQIRFASEDGTWSIVFSVAANGENPVISEVTIPGHTGASIQIQKESSSLQIKVYEGTYGTGDKDAGLGVCNFVTGRRDSLFGIIEMPPGSKVVTYGHLYPAQDSLVIMYHPFEFRAEGNFKGDSLATGRWVRQDQQKGAGKWQVRRTL